MSDCQHDERFSGVFFLPKETRGCLACMVERQAAAIEAKDAEIAKLQAVVDVATTALEKLSRLGNEPHLGNSDGNVIAHIALKEIAALNTGEQDK